MIASYFFKKLYELFYKNHYFDCVVFDKDFRIVNLNT